LHWREWTVLVHVMDNFPWACNCTRASGLGLWCCRSTCHLPGRRRIDLLPANVPALPEDQDPRQPNDSGRDATHLGARITGAHTLHTCHRRLVLYEHSRRCSSVMIIREVHLQASTRCIIARHEVHRGVHSLPDDANALQFLFYQRGLTTHCPTGPPGTIPASPQWPGRGSRQLRLDLPGRQRPNLGHGST